MGKKGNIMDAHLSCTVREVFLEYIFKHQRPKSLLFLPYLPKVFGQTGLNKQCRPRSDAAKYRHSSSNEYPEWDISNWVLTISINTYKMSFHAKITKIIIWATPCENMSSGICRQQRLRSDCASAQSDQDLLCLLTESLDTTECMNEEQRLGHSCSKLTMSLVNDSLKCTSSDIQICWNYLLKKCE